MEEENGQMELRSCRACRVLNMYQPSEDETLSESSTMVAPESYLIYVHLSSSIVCKGWLVAI